MDFFHTLHPQAVLLTPNRRLRATLLAQYQQLQLASQKITWPSLDILPFSSWIERLWQTYTLQHFSKIPLLLTTHQELMIWEEIILASPASEHLLNINSTAEWVKSAWSMLKQWRIPLDHPELSLTEDGAVFYTWATQFEKECQSRNTIDTASLMDFISEKIQSKEISVPEEILLIGFTDITPQAEHLFHLCQEKGSTLRHEKTSSRQATLAHISLSDEETELHTQAQWAKSLFDQASDRTTLSIGCVIPQLEKKRDQVIRIFSSVFSEKTTHILDYTELSFNISAGKSLADYPIIHAALTLLKLNHTSFSSETFSMLLRSPFLGEAEQEMIKRAHLDHILHESTVTLETLNTLLKLDSTFSLKKTCPLLATRIEAFLALRSSRATSQKISEWTTYFMNQLNALGWPGERSLNSQEYQVVHRWLDLLAEFSSYDSVIGKKNEREALHALTSLTSKTIFQPQSPAAPIQILGLLEAADLSFDYLWVTGLTDTDFPPAAKPNPFIPLRLQKALSMPHSTAEREFFYCEKLFGQFKHAAHHVILSHAQHNGETELRPSPFLQHIPKITLENITLSESHSYANTIYHAQKLEWIKDERASPLTEKILIQGGSAIFKLQAACPFKAFAELRLQAKAVEPTEKGLDAKERGKIVHHVLEYIWRTLRTQKNLLQKTEDQLNHLIHQAVTEALKKIIEKKPTQTRYFLIEKERLIKMITRWLSVEKSRPDFQVILLEEERHITLGKIPLTLRIDRIDELNDGNQLIIDYKTGKYHAIHDWFGDRLQEPQLPLYCATDSGNTVGIAFAELHPEALKLTGISAYPLDISTVKTLTEVSYREANSWDEQLHYWQKTLEKLGDDFYQGVAIVDPKDPNDTCQHCHLHALCRIHEKMRMD